MEENCNIPKMPVKTSLFLPLILSLISFCVYLLTLYRGLFPGDGVTFLAKAWGVYSIPGTVSSSPILAELVKFFSLFTGNGLPQFCTIFTAFLAAVNVFLVYKISALFYFRITYEKNSVKLIAKATTTAASLSAICYAFSSPVWQSATHFQMQTFDSFLIFAALTAILSYTHKANVCFLVLGSFLSAISMVESPTGLLLTVAFLPAILIAIISSCKKFSWLRILIFAGIPFLIGLLSYFFAIKQIQSGSEISSLVAFKMLIASYLGEIISFFKSGPWLIVAFLGVVPGFVSMMTAPKILNNERSFVLTFILTTISLLIFLSILPFSISPFYTIDNSWVDSYPLVIAFLVSFAVGYIFAACKMLRCVNDAKEGADVNETTKKTSIMLGFILPIPLCLTIIAGIAITFFSVFLRGDNGTAFRSEPPLQSIIISTYNALDGREWLIGDSILNPYLAIHAKQNDKDLNIIQLSQDDNLPYMRTIWEKFQEAKTVEGNPTLLEQLKRDSEVGVIPFIHDWLDGDPDVIKKISIWSIPDFWYFAKKMPCPNTMVINGSKNLETLKTDLPRNAIQILDKFEPLLEIDNEKSKSALSNFKKIIRRQMGFVANNVGFYLAEINEKEEAYDVFRRVVAFDPDNISALFNLFELINSGLHPEERDVVAKKLDTLVRSLHGRKYEMWALSRFYGYIRSAQLISSIAGQWAMSGHPNAAHAGIAMTAGMLTEEQQNNAHESITAIYNMLAGKQTQNKNYYLKSLENSTNVKQQITAIHELIRIALLANNLQEAEGYLLRAEKFGRPSEFSLDKAAIYMTKGDLTNARIAVQSYCELYPKNIQALSMLAAIQMQAGEYNDVKNVTLKKLEAAVARPSDYFLQVLKAQIFLHDATEKNISPEKLKELRTKARNAFLVAYEDRPDAGHLRDTILELDLTLDDNLNAEKHARQMIRSDRNHPLSNYVMGSLRLRNGDLTGGINFLAIAAKTEKPATAVLNDLAEAYRLYGDIDAALATIRKATELNPEFYILWDTLSSILVAKENYKEAEVANKKSIELWKKAMPNKPMDPRVLMTKGIIEVKTNRIPDARETLTEIEKQNYQFSQAEQKQFNDFKKLCYK